MPLLIAFVSFAILIGGSIGFSNYKKELREKDVKARLFELLLTRTTKLQIALYSRIHYTRSVAAYVSSKPEITAIEFHQLAEALIQDDSIISTMGLSKDCILGAIYPEKGHEAAIGLNLLDHPARRDIVEQTIKTHKTFIAGPVELVEGGIAFISYTPIFDKSKGETNHFWGVTDIVISQDRLIKDAGLHENELGFLFAIRGQDGTGKNGRPWWGNPNVFEQNPITNEIKLPTGNWQIAAIPEKGWDSYLKRDNELLIVLFSCSLIISLLIWLIGRTMSKNRINERLSHAQLQKSFDQLNEVESRFKKLFMEAPMGIALVESNSGKIVEVNPMFAQIAGRTIDEMKHIDWMQITHPEDIQEDLDQMALLNAGKIKGFLMEKRYLQKDGRPVWISMTIAPIFVEDPTSPRHLCMIEDISNRKKMEEELFLEQQFSKNLLDSLPGIFFLYTYPDLQLIRWNRNHETLLGFSANELKNTVITNWIRTEVKNNILGAVETIIKDGAVTIESVLYAKDGRSIPFIMNGVRLETQGKKYIMGFGIEMSELKQARANLHLKNVELQKTNATKDKFFSIIAHDLKSPFNSIIGFSNLIVEKVKEKEYEGVEKYADIIQQSSFRAMDLLANLMEWSQSQTGRVEFNPEYFELVELIKDTEAMVAGALEQKSITLTKDVPSNAPVFADKRMIGSVMRNLISNAVKFSHPGGEIHVSIIETPNEVLVSVRDNGVGISKPNCEKLFKIDQTYSTKGTNNEMGTGLGLILCNEFVKMHHGKIWVDSEEGKGSTFKFSLPAKL